MIIVIKLKDTDNIIGLKEEIAMRLEDVVGIERIDVREGGDENGRGAVDKALRGYVRQT